MKIAMIGLRGLDDGLGGVEKVVRETAVRLVQLGAEVTCFCRPRYNDKSEWEGVRLVNTRTLYTKHGETAFYAFGSMIEAARGDYDVIHIHAMASAFLGWIPRWFSDKKVVVTIHGLDWQRAKWGFLARKVLHMGEWCAVHMSDYTTCVSLSLLVYFQMRYLHHPFAYIPNSYDPPSGAVPPPEEYADGRYILYMGRLVPEKGVDRLIRAFKEVETDYRLLIAGPHTHASDYAQQLQQLAAEDERVELIGAITGERKERLLSHAFLFVLPSEIEGLPVALLEAAGRGVCPLISNIPTNLEVLGSRHVTRGFTFNPASTGELRTALEACLENPELTRSLGEQARKHVSENYSWDTAAEETLNVYESVMAS